MAPSENSDPDRPNASRRRRRRPAAFSLVEVALALGIVAFALVPVFGLLPIGLASFRKGMDLSVGAQITQRIVDEAQQSDFETLLAGHPNAFTEPVRYFSAQGEELTEQGKMLGSPAEEKFAIIYRVNTQITPSTALPGPAAAGGGTAPATSGVPNPNIATVTVQVANNPGNRSMSADPDSGLWTASRALPLTTSSTYVARNSALPR